LQTPDDAQKSEELRARLEEAEEIVRALRAGEVDVLVISGQQGERVYSLKGAEHPYRVMVEVMNEGAFTLTRDGTIFYSNGAFAAILKLPLEEVIGSTIRRFVLADDLPACEKLIQEGRESGSKGEVRLMASDGSVAPVDFSIRSLESVAPGSVCVVATDLSERKRNEELMASRAQERARLAEAEAARQRVNAVLESITDSYFQMDRAWRITEINQHAAANFGATREQLLGTVFWDALPEGKAPELGEQYRKGMESRVAVHFEGPSGSAPGRWFERHLYPTDEGLAVYFRDISERKRMEAHIAYQAMLLANVNDAIVATDDQFRLTAWNARAEELYGWKAKGALGRPVGEVIRSKFTDFQRAESLKSLRESGHYDVEVAQYSRSGKRIWVQGHVSTLRDQSGNITGYLGVNRDITERKQAEERLQRSEAYLAEGQKISHTGSWAVKFPSGELTWSREVYRIYDLDPASAKLSQEMAFHLVHPEDRQSVKVAFDRAIRDKTDYSVEYRAILPDGSIKYLHVLGHPVLEGAGALTEYIGTVMDITERKRTEAFLREANERVEMILDSITDRFFTFDKEWRFRYMNKHAEEHVKALGKDPARLIGKVNWEEFPADPAVEEAFRRAMRDRVVITHEHYDPSLGEWVENRLYPSSGGGVAVFQRYITERKEIEEKLRRSEAYLAEAERLSHTASWAWNVSTGELFWSKEHSRIFGLDPETVKPTYEIFFQMVHPDDRSIVRLKFERAVSERADFDGEFRIVRPDGTVRQIHSISHPVFREGDLTEYIGTIIDVTEQNRAEEERTQLLRRLIGAQGEERQRISRQLHDEMGQLVSALTVRISALKAQPGGGAEFGEQMDALDDIARQLDAAVDFLVWELRPTVLGDRGLSVALANYVTSWTGHFSIRAELHTSEMEHERLPEEIEMVLYRITQEGLTNVAKHAKATKVDILLESRSNYVSLIIEDDGVGFDLKPALGRSERELGLIGMRERATLVGGVLEIESRPGAGTTIRVRIPNRPVSGGNADE
jgi:PAS domain S-box-containing protein